MSRTSNTPTRLGWPLIAVLIVMLADPVPGLAQCEIERWVRPESEEEFGLSVAIADGYALVGSPFDGPSLFGVVAVYRLDGEVWTEAGQLTSSNPVQFAAFGFDLGIDGDVAIVGADVDVGPGSGEAYLFRLAGDVWEQEQILFAAGGVLGDEFGVSVSVDGGIAVVGALASDAPSVDSGSAYVFRFDGCSWNEEEELTASDGAESDLFGVSIANDSDVIVVGAERGDGAESDTGTAYVFRYSGIGWDQEQELSSPNGQTDDLFGFDVDVEGDLAVVGAPGDDDEGDGAGAVYVFRFDGLVWVQEAKLTYPDRRPGDTFGVSVAVAGDVLVVGASRSPISGAEAGAVHVFRCDGSSWNLERTLFARDASAVDVLGRSVATDGEFILAGDPGAESGSGAAYLFEADASMFIRGDGNADGHVDIGDPIYNLSYLFVDPSSVCLEAQDTNDDGAVDIADPIYNLAFLFSLGPAPSAPFGVCGFDLDMDFVCCAGSPGCP